MGLPCNVTVFVDRHGRKRFRFRKVGLPVHYFISRPGTIAFLEEYDDCLADRAHLRERPAPRPPRRRTKRAGPKIERVYFIGGMGGPIKIGRSVDPRKRLQAHQTSHRFAFACSPPCQAVERWRPNITAGFRLSDGRANGSKGPPKSSPNSTELKVVWLTIVAGIWLTSKERIEYARFFGSGGDPDRIRTCGLLIRNQSLYPAELRDHRRGAVWRMRRLRSIRAPRLTPF